MEIDCNPTASKPNFIKNRCYAARNICNSSYAIWFAFINNLASAAKWLVYV